MSVPTLRFKDDDGQEFPEWEEKNISEVLKIGSGKDYKKLVSGDIPVYGTGGYMLSVNDYLYDGESVCIGRKGTIDRPVLLTGKFWTVDTLFYTHSFIKSLPRFIYAVFQNIDWKSYNEASGVPSLSKSTIEKIEINIPSLPEQTKIANFLTAIDEKISLLTQKSYLLSQYKKGVMQQIFSQELRFKDDDGQEFPEWEEKTLGEVTTYTKGFAFKSDDYQEDGIRIIRVSDLTASAIKQNNKSIFIDSSKIDKYESYRIKRNDILITTVGSKPDLIESAVGRGILITNNDEGLLNQNLLKLNHSTGLENGFLFRQINSERYITHIKNIQRGNANQSNITLKDLFEFVVFICGYKEQTKIANFLTAIDEKITNNQTQLDAVKQYKQGLLQQMFV